MYFSLQRKMNGNPGKLIKPVAKLGKEISTSQFIAVNSLVDNTRHNHKPLESSYIHILYFPQTYLILSDLRFLQLLWKVCHSGIWCYVVCRWLQIFSGTIQLFVTGVRSWMEFDLMYFSVFIQWCNMTKITLMLNVIKN
jgi:hypothetical protein